MIKYSQLHNQSVASARANACRTSRFKNQYQQSEDRILAVFRSNSTFLVTDDMASKGVADLVGDYLDLFANIS